MGNIRKTEVQWNLTYKGEPMYSPIFSGYDDVVSYLESAPDDQRGEYAIIHRVIVTETSPWQEWN